MSGHTVGESGANWHPGQMAPHVFLLTCLLPTYGDDVFMFQVYQPEYQELMAAKPGLV